MGGCIGLTCGKNGDGAVCAFDSDCNSGDGCVELQCGKKDDGSVCALSSACKSGKCGTVDKRCFSPVDDGEWCTYNSDCKSGFCSTARSCKTKTAKGGSCALDRDC